MSTIQYNPKRGKYLKLDGRVASDRELRDWQAAQIKSAKTQFRNLAQRRLQGTLSNENWGQEFKAGIREQHYQMAAVAAGGEERITPQMRWAIDGLISEEIGYFNRFQSDYGNSQDLATEYRLRIIQRAGRYASAIKMSFSRVELLVRIAEGGWEGWRQISSDLTTCKNCPDHRTLGYVPVEQIVAIGDRCVCRSNCQCKIRFRRRR